MFDPNFKCLSFRLFIFPAIALALAPSLAISQDKQMEETIVEEIGSEEVVSEALSFVEDPVISSPSIQLSTVDLMTQTDIKPMKGSQAKDSDGTLFGITALLVPHVAIVCGLIVGLSLIRLILRWRELVHREHLAAIEKGIGWGQMSRQRLMLWGMIWIGLGIATSVALWVNFNWSNAMWGLMPLLLGLALLVSAGLIERNGTRHPTQIAPTT